MLLSTKKGIILEQNKEPMLSKGIKRLELCDEVRAQIALPVSGKPDLLAPHEIVSIAKLAKVTDETDQKRLWKKMSAAIRQGIDTIVVDAIDDEPYISSQLAPALHLSDKLSQGMALMKRAIGATNMRIEIYRNLFDINMKIPSQIGGVKVELVGGNYPAEHRALKKRKHESAVVVGSCALLALRDAAYEGTVHNTCFVTVSGDCVSNPANYEVPIGMPAQQLLQYAGLITDPRRVVVGGSMTGFTIEDTASVPITPMTRGLLAFVQEYQKLEYPCIGCGRCTKACPQDLSPYLIYQLLNSRAGRHLEMLDADRCISCGSCSYVCPAKLDLQQTVQEAAKLTLKKESIQ